jgi:hypothetical protein
MIKEEQLGQHDQGDAERKPMPVVRRKFAIEPKGKRRIVRTGEQRGIADHFYASTQTTVSQIFHFGQATALSVTSRMRAKISRTDSGSDPQSSASPGSTSECRAISAPRRL